MTTHQSEEAARLAEFSRAVRESTLKRLRRVPPGLEDWRIADEALSFADHAKHLIDCDECLFTALEEESLRPLVGIAGCGRVADRCEYLDMLGRLEQIGERRAGMLEGMTDGQLSAVIVDPRFGDEETAWWTIVRGNLDHEIHHRGQIAAYLRACMNP